VLGLLLSNESPTEYIFHMHKDLYKILLNYQVIRKNETVSEKSLN